MKFYRNTLIERNKRNLIPLISGIIMFFNVLNLPAQIEKSPIQALTLLQDTASYSLQNHSINLSSGNHLYFYHNSDHDVLSIKLSLLNDADDIELLPTYNYKVLDNLEKDVFNQYTGKIQFNQIEPNDQFLLKFSYQKENESEPQIYTIPLLPLYQTKIAVYPDSDELFQGEIKSFPITSNRLKNIKGDPFWKSQGNLDYRIIRKKDTPILEIKSNTFGKASLSLKANTKTPYLNSENELVYSSNIIQLNFQVKKTRLQYLTLSKSLLYFDFETMHQAKSIEIKYNPNIKLKKTYRLENRQKEGGHLVAEIFTKEIISNGRILCDIRTYSYHNKEDGYLYIKRNESALFLTNIDIIPKTNIEQIMIQRPGKDWKVMNQLYPGEKVKIKLKGKSLTRAQIKFESLTNVSLDSINRNDQQLEFSAFVPKTIQTKSIKIMNRNVPTGRTLVIKEHQKPKAFDYIKVSSGYESFSMGDVAGQFTVNHHLKDLVLSFDRNKIDENDDFHGKQYLQIGIEVRSAKNQLIDSKKINRLVICPGPKSKRYDQYDQKDCFKKKKLSLNDYLRTKIYSLYPWSSIQLTFSQIPQKYEGPIIESKVNIFLKEKVSFDIDVSFPAGLVVKEVGEDGFSNLGGISLATIAQFSFYQPGKINKLRPYKIGAGFLAFNAFNFNSAANNRDVGIVFLGSVYPLQRYERKKLSFPIYLGGGYFLSKERWFFLFGPGIRVRL